MMERLRQTLAFRWLMLRVLVAEVLTWYVLNVVPPAGDPASGDREEEPRAKIERASFELVYGDPSEVRNGPRK